MFNTARQRWKWGGVKVPFRAPAKKKTSAIVQSKGLFLTGRCVGGGRVRCLTHELDDQPAVYYFPLVGCQRF